MHDRRVWLMVVVTALLLFVGPVLRGSQSQSTQKTKLDIVAVRFEPLRQGKNVVHVQVHNASEPDQMFRTHIYTRSPEYGRNGVGWGTGFFETIPAQATKWTRFAFKIHGPLTDSTYLRLTFSNPGAAEDFDEEVWTKSEGWRQSFRKTTYPASDLVWRKDESERAEPTTAEQADAVAGALERMQIAIRNADYDRAWQGFTLDYQQAEFQATMPNRFIAAMELKRLIDSAFGWEREAFLSLRPSRVLRIGECLRLLAESEGQGWTLDFVQDDDEWKVDWIAGYTPRYLKWQDWEKYVLPRMTCRQIPHFDIYYFPDSTAARQIDQLARDKEKGYAEICAFLDRSPDIRIRLVLFEDGQTKHLETGHQGMGWAYDRTIVEVYNEAEQLDPYHETVHILTGSLGHPPALFVEGFAVYMSEHLGAHALEDLSGGAATIDERVAQLREKGDWIELSELIAYVEIGSYESRPPVAYAEAAGFVKFLIDEYGKDRFLQTYRQLVNSNDANVHERNARTLNAIYGASLAELDRRWQEEMSHGNL